MGGGLVSRICDGVGDKQKEPYGTTNYQIDKLINKIRILYKKLAETVGFEPTMRFWHILP